MVCYPKPPVGLPTLRPAKQAGPVEGQDVATSQPKPGLWPEATGTANRCRRQHTAATDWHNLVSDVSTNIHLHYARTISMTTNTKVLIHSYE